MAPYGIKRLGSVKQAIKAAFEAAPSSTFTIAELAPLAYPDAAQIERKHLVALRRSIDDVAGRLGWEFLTSSARGHSAVYVNPCDVRSYGIGRLRAGPPPYSADEAARLLDRSDYRRLIEPGGAWWRHVELVKAKRAGDSGTAKALLEEIEAHDHKARLLGAHAAIAAGARPEGPDTRNGLGELGPNWRRVMNVQALIEKHASGARLTKDEWAAVIAAAETMLRAAGAK